MVTELKALFPWLLSSTSILLVVLFSGDVGYITLFIPASLLHPAYSLAPIVGGFPLTVPSISVVTLAIEIPACNCP